MASPIHRIPSSSAVFARSTNLLSTRWATIASLTAEGREGDEKHEAE